MSNGLIGFAENSKAVEADEDKNLFVHLILTRLNAFFGDVLVFWRAKLSNASSEAEDLFLSTQLVSVMGNTTCPAGQSQCALDIVLINDTVSSPLYENLSRTKMKSTACYTVSADLSFFIFFCSSFSF